MALTPAQNATLKAYVEADGTLNTLPHDNGGAVDIATAMNAEANPAWYVFRTNVSVSEVQNKIVYANMTPAQAIPANNTNESLQIWIAKNLLAQGKQFNLQNLLLNADAINFALPNVYTAFQDALTALPTKSDGTNQQAGWTGLQLITSRKANTVEKLLSTGTGSQAASATMGFEGSVSYGDVFTAMGW